jgi:beta-aspartyl-peptidase (threonine type)
MTQSIPILALHGGAGTISRSAITPAQEREYLEALQHVLRSGQELLTRGVDALDSVTEAVRLLEECPLFNAGKGSVFTAAGTQEMDAAVMDGKTLAAGAVACVGRIAHPVLAARAVMEHSGHVLMVGEGAEAFAAAEGLEMAEPSYFYTDFRFHQWQKARSLTANPLLDHDAANLAASGGPGIISRATQPPLDPDRKFGTVGAVALDARGNLAAAASTGGLTNKREGRVGDTPLIGAGCYADNRTAAVVTTGEGEMFIRIAAAHDLAAQMEYGHRSLAEAAEHIVRHKLPQIQGRGGLVAVDHHGNVVLPFNTEGMYRGYARVGQEPFAAIYGPA